MGGRELLPAIGLVSILILLLKNYWLFLVLLMYVGRILYVGIIMVMIGNYILGVIVSLLYVKFMLLLLPLKMIFWVLIMII